MRKIRLRGLTRRESEIALLRARGFLGKQVAAKLKISHGVVKNVLTRIYRRLGVDDQEGRKDIQLVRYVFKSIEEHAYQLESDYRRRKAKELSQCEAKIALLKASGWRTKEIARRFHLAPQTVKNHIQATYRKLGICKKNPRPQLIRYLLAKLGEQEYYYRSSSRRT